MEILENAEVGRDYLYMRAHIDIGNSSITLCRCIETRKNRACVILLAPVNRFRLNESELGDYLPSLISVSVLAWLWH